MGRWRLILLLLLCLPLTGNIPFNPRIDSDWFREFNLGDGSLTGLPKAFPMCPREGWHESVTIGITSECWVAYPLRITSVAFMLTAETIVGDCLLHLAVDGVVQGWTDIKVGDDNGNYDNSTCEELVDENSDGINDVTVGGGGAADVGDACVQQDAVGSVVPAGGFLDLYIDDISGETACTRFESGHYIVMGSWILR